jgi:hypothetical protein
MCLPGSKTAIPYHIALGRIEKKQGVGDSATPGRDRVPRAPGTLASAPLRRCSARRLLQKGRCTSEGFLTFSKLRPSSRQGRFSSIQAALQPPYGKRAKLALDWMFRLRG